MLVPRLKTQNQCPSSFIPPFVSYLNGNPKLSCWTGTKLTIWLPDGWTFKHPNVECSNKSCELFFILTSFILFSNATFHFFFPKKDPGARCFFSHHDFQALWIGDLTLLLSSTWRHCLSEISVNCISCNKAHQLQQAYENTRNLDQTTKTSFIIC